MAHKRDSTDFPTHHTASDPAYLALGSEDPPREGAERANRRSLRRFQRGYLLEIPILLFILVLVLSILIPRLSFNGQKVLLGLAAVPILFCLFYIIVAPGWVPQTSGRVGRGFRVALFLGCAAAIVAGVASFLLR